LTPAQEAGKRARYYALQKQPELAKYWQEKENQYTEAERAAQKEGATQTVKEGNERFQKIQDASTQAAEAAAHADLFEAAMAKMPTGPGAARTLTIAKWASELGMSPGVIRALGYKDDDSVSAAQLMESIASRGTLNAGQAMKGSFSDKDIAFLKGIGLSMANTPGGNAALIQFTRANADFAQKLGEAASAYKRVHGTLDDGWHDVAREIYKNHPLKAMAEDWKAKTTGNTPAAAPAGAKGNVVKTSAPGQVNIADGTVAQDAKGNTLVHLGGSWLTQEDYNKATKRAGPTPADASQLTKDFLSQPFH
jgi:hypothetical protein